jgi:hypothetical protein
VKPREEYRRKCGATDYSETREYTINIISRTTQGGNTLVLITKLEQIAKLLYFLIRWR